jgi:rhomboid family protein
LIPLYDDNPARRAPVITVALIVANVVIFLFWQPHGGRTETAFLYRQAAIPCEVITGAPVDIRVDPGGGAVGCDLRGGSPRFPDKNVYLAIIVSMFLHANLLHIGGNMLFLWIFGNNVEDRMGHVAYLGFYFACGIIAAMSHILLFRDSAVPLLGASGAIAGVMGAYLVCFPKARVLTLVFFIALWLPAWLVLGLWFLGQFGISASNAGVATAAHIGGFTAGVLTALIFLGPRRREYPRAWRYQPY